MSPVVLTLLLALQQSPTTTAPPQAPVTQLPDVRATGATPATATAGEADDQDRVICRRERVLGSNRPQRVCMTRREWSRASDTTQEELRNVRGGAESLPGDRGGGSL